MTDLPVLNEQPDGLVTKRELAAALGYSESSMDNVLRAHPDWPGAVARLRVGRTRPYLYDLAAMLTAAGLPAVTRRRRSRPTVSDEDGLIVCLECKRKFRALGKHLVYRHGMSSVEYRERHQLPASAALAADSVRDRMRERMAGEDTTHLDRYRTRERLDEIRDVEAQKATGDFELVRAARLPGRRRSAAVMQRRRAELLEAKVRAAGWESVDAGVRATLHLLAREAAERLGVSENTVRRRRGSLPPAAP